MPAVYGGLVEFMTGAPRAACASRRVFDTKFLEHRSVWFAWNPDQLKLGRHKLTSTSTMTLTLDVDLDGDVNVRLHPPTLHLDDAASRATIGSTFTARSRPTTRVQVKDQVDVHPRS